MKKRTLSPTFVIAVSIGILCLFLSVSHAARSADMPMNIARIIDRDRVMLSDVFADIPKSKDTDLGPAPRPGEDVTLDVRTLMKLASAYGVPFRPISTQDQVVLKRAGTIITSTDQKDFLVSAMTPQIQGKFNVVLNSNLMPIYLKTGASSDLKMGPITFDARNDTFDTTMMLESDPSNLRTISGRIERLIDVPVPRSNIVRGSLISAGDFDFTEMKSTDIKGDIVLNLDQIVGRTARNNLNPGRLIRLADTEIPVTIRRGEKINLIYKSGHLELTAVGRSMQDGRVGDIIRVANGDSNKNLQGTVLANNQVEIDE